MAAAEELRQMKLGALQKQARAHGVPSDTVDDAADADDPRQELIGLILEVVAASGDLLRAELSELKLGALQKRARAAGADGDSVDDAADADDPKAELIGMVRKSARVLLTAPCLFAPPWLDFAHVLLVTQIVALAQQTPPPSSPAAAAAGAPASPAAAATLDVDVSSTPPASPAGGAAAISSAQLTPTSSAPQPAAHYGADAMREASHLVLHQQHLTDTIGEWRRPKQPPLAEFLGSVGCTEAEATIRENGFDTVEDLMDGRLDEADLKDLGCVMMKPRKKMFHALHALAVCLSFLSLVFSHIVSQLSHRSLIFACSQKQETQQKQEAEAAQTAAQTEEDDRNKQVEEGVPEAGSISAADAAEMEALRAENVKLKAKLSTLRELLGVGAVAVAKQDEGSAPA